MAKIFNKELDKEDKKEGLFKRLKNIEDKNEEQLKVLKDQAEKQPLISKVKNLNFSNVPFRNLLDAKSMEVFNKIEITMKLLIIHGLILSAHLKSILLILKFYEFRKSCWKYLHW